ncbi:MAG: PAS domain S-box protein [Candidatus Xenobia bacterium]
MNRWVRRALESAGIALLCVAIARVQTLTMDPRIAQPELTLVSGLALAAFLCGGLWMLPGLVVGSLIAQVPLYPLVGPLVAAGLLRKFTRFDVGLRRSHDVLLLGAAAVFGSALSALMAPEFLTSWNRLQAGTFAVAPLLLFFTGRVPRPTFNLGRLLEGLALAAVFVLWCSEVFSQPQPGTFWLLVPLLYGAYRFHQTGALLGSFFLAVIALVATVHGHGPFASENPLAAHTAVQALICTTMVGSLLLAAKVDEFENHRGLLAESEERYRVMAETTRDAIILIDDRQRILYFSPGAQRMFNRAAQDVIGRELIELMPEPVREEQRQAIAQEMQATRNFILLDLIGECSGHRIDLEASLAPTPTRSGLRHTVVLRDVTARKSDEILLRQSLERLQQLTDNIGEVFWMSTPDLSEMVYVSRAYEEVWGATRQSLYEDPRSFLSHVHPDDRAGFEQVIANAIECRFEHEYRVVRPDHELRWIHDRGFPVYDAEGKLHRRAGVASDITQRRRLELGQTVQAEVLQVLAQRLVGARYSRVSTEDVALAVLTTAGRGLAWDRAVMWKRNPDTDEPNAVVTWDPAPQTSPPSTMDGVREAFTRASLIWDCTEHATSVSIPFVRDHRVEFVVEWLTHFVRPLDPVDEQPLTMATHYLGLFLERRRSEMELRASHRLLEETLQELKATQDNLVQQERLRAIGQMASGIAHDILNHLSIVSMFTQLALADPELPATLQPSLDHILQAAHDAAAVISRLREFYRPASADHLERISLSAFVADVVQLTQPKWKDEPESRGVHIEAVTQLDAQHAILASTSSLRLAITNFILNAIDAMPGGGKLRLSTWDEGPLVALRIEDTGVGMDAATRKLLFEPFFTTKGSKGTGLGLSVSWGTLQRHGTQIEVESEPGHGSRFTIHFPAAVPDDGPPEPAQAPPSLPALRLLCIDDEPLIRDGLQTLLSTMGHFVVTASNGKEALELFTPGQFDVVITDLGMPGLSGAEVAARVKRIAPLMPVILLTGWGEQVAEGLSSVDYVLDKPPTGAALSTALVAVGLPQKIRQRSTG